MNIIIDNELRKLYYTFESINTLNLNLKFQKSYFSHLSS